MQYRLILKKKVLSDILEEFLWYEEQSTGLGKSFEKEFYTTLNLVVDNPHIGPIAYLDFRRVILRKFPFAIYYQIENSKITVFGCLDLRQDPKRILAELNESDLES